MREPRPLHSMFSSVDGPYDRMNRLLTLGLDERWRRLAARVILEPGPLAVLDLCSGTGDLIAHLAAAAGREVQLVAADFARPMLERARQKAVKRGIGDRIRFVHADAGALPFADGRFDTVGIAFGFRNLTYKNPRTTRYLAELRRILSPSGRCVIVETSQPDSWLLKALTHAYYRAWVGPVGGWVSGQRKAYRYLAHSARCYYHPEEVSKLLHGAGLDTVSFKRLAGGIAGVHVVVRGGS